MGNTLCAIESWDRRGQKQVDDLLRQEGIRRDRNLSYTCGVYSEDMELIATGSSFGNTLRCLAVASDHRGEGLMNQVVSHLMERQIAQGHTRVFLYTKPQSTRLLGDLGFYEVARLQDMVMGQREYVSQLRDLMQTQLDVRQNRIMTVLTVITSIFMPLTLIAGWYGMNFRYMPELEWRLGYPVVIAVSLVIVVASLVFFKKKRWL